jgi:3-methyladenine DNA glycosylase AlkC
MVPGRETELKEPAMAEDDRSEAPALKEIFNRARLRHIAAEMAAAYPKFDADRFLALAGKNLDTLSIMQRLRQVTESLHAVLPGDFAKNIAILKKVAPQLNHGFVALVLSEYVAQYGQGDFALSMEALAFFTGFGSAEFAIRHFLRRDFARTIKVMERWTKSKDEHVRRLASEGSRPRLPWSARLDRVIADPSLTAPILEALKSDPSAMVRRSVANHLNDITKDHPDWALRRAATWSMKNKHTAWIVKHALRSLIKQGEPAALALIGATGKPKVRVTDFQIAPVRIKLGGKIALSCAIRSTSAEMQTLVIDYAIHYVKKSGETSRKVFKLKQITLAPNETVQIARGQAIRDFTTRVHYAGRHAVELLINGECKADGTFDLIR